MASYASAAVFAAARGRQHLIAWLLRAIGWLLIAWLMLASVLVAWRTLQSSSQPLRLGALVLSVVILAAATWFMRARQRASHDAWSLWRVGPPPGPSSPRVLQQFTRSLSAEGEETIEGSVTISVDRGSKTGAAHVGFCPPFAARPQFELRPTSGRGVVLKVGQLLPQGVRIEAKLPAPAAATRIVSVQFVARSRSDAHGPMAV